MISTDYELKLSNPEKDDPSPAPEFPPQEPPDGTPKPGDPLKRPAPADPTPTEPTRKPPGPVEPKI